jgi:hypothetical protein
MKRFWRLVWRVYDTPLVARLIPSKYGPQLLGKALGTEPRLLVDDPYRPGWYHDAPMICEQHPDRWFSLAHQTVCAGPGISLGTPDRVFKYMPGSSPYPFSDGPVVVLGPEVFASTSTPTEETVIAWKGQNFYPSQEIDTLNADGEEV